LATSAGEKVPLPPELEPDASFFTSEDPLSEVERKATLPPFYTSDKFLRVLAKSYLQAAFPLTLPYTTQSKREHPPSLLTPWTPPQTSPVAYNPSIGAPLVPTI